MEAPLFPPSPADTAPVFVTASPLPEETLLPEEFVEVVGYEEIVTQLQITNQFLTWIFALLFIAIVYFILSHFLKLISNTLFHHIM